MNRWRLSKLAFVADFILAPLYVGGALAAAGIPYSMLWCGLFTIGFVAWTLTEYWMHRSLFHRFYRLEHGLHHIRPRDWIGVAPYITGAAFFVVWLFAVVTFDGVGRGGVVFAGFIVGYYAYIVIHALIHHSSTRMVAGLRAAHEAHHRGANANFGVITNFWDRVFGTLAK